MPLQETDTIAPGVLLVASPEMLDPNFRRSVVLICTHNDDGTFGLVLNRQLKERMCDLPLDLDSQATLSLGGPVQPDTLHYLHLYGDLMEGSVPIKGRLHWGGDFSAVRMLLDLKAATSKDIRFFVGYSGWSAGQLEDEIQFGGWLVVEGDNNLVFSDQPEGLWRTVLARMGGEFALLVNYPEDPRFN